MPTRLAARPASFALRGALVALVHTAACQQATPPEWKGDPAAFETRVPPAPTMPPAMAAPEWMVRSVRPDSGIERFALAGDYLYFAAGPGGLYRTRKPGGGPIEVVEAGWRTVYTEVAAGGAQVYWLKVVAADDETTHASVRTQGSGGDKIDTRFEGDWGTLHSATAAHFQADLAGVYLHATPRGGRSSGIQNLPAGGGNPIEMLQIRDITESPPWTVDERDLYFTPCQADACRVARVSKTGGEVVTVAEVPASYIAVRAVDASDVFITSNNVIWRLPKQGGELTILFNMRAVATVLPAVVIDERNLYFIERRSGVSRVRAVPKTGGAAALLATANWPSGIIQMAQDETNLYLLHGKGELLVQPKVPPVP